MEINVYGRNSESTIRITDASVSSRHARLEIIDGSWFVEDLNSTNGTFVNGKKVSRLQIVNGDVIHLGTFKTQFENGQLIVPQTEVFSASAPPDEVLSTNSKSQLNRKLVVGFLASSIFLLTAVLFVNLISSERPTVSDASKATVFIEVSNSQDDKCWIGSGFLVGDGSLVATNAHVAAPSSDASYAEKDCTRIRIGYTTNSQEVPSMFRQAVVIEISEVDDLALLQISKPLNNLGGLALSDETATIGAPLTVFGYPGLGGATITVNNGVVSGFDNSDGDEYIKISAAINSGNSGGPVLGEDGKVLGVASAANLAGVECSDDGDCYTDGQNVGLARPIKLISQWLAQRSN